MAQISEEKFINKLNDDIKELKKNIQQIKEMLSSDHGTPGICEQVRNNTDEIRRIKKKPTTTAETIILIGRVATNLSIIFGIIIWISRRL